jgi:hypothetical protein
VSERWSPVRAAAVADAAVADAAGPTPAAELNARSASGYGRV